MPESKDSTSTKRSDAPYRDGRGGGFQQLSGLRPMSPEREAEVEMWRTLNQRVRGR
jgi:hypothetical protein